jgi:hypothetical protein
VQTSTQTRPEPLDDTGIWGLVFASGHWACGGWTVDSRDNVLICACGADLRDAEAA